VSDPDQVLRDKRNQRSRGKRHQVFLGKRIQCRDNRAPSLKGYSVQAPATKEWLVLLLTTSRKQKKR